VGKKSRKEERYRLFPIVPGLGGIALFVKGAFFDRSWWMTVFGLGIALIASYSPRLKGPFDIRFFGRSLQFRGELTKPPTSRQRNNKTAHKTPPELPAHATGIGEGAQTPPGDEADPASGD
jgi:hypothetical protein